MAALPPEEAEPAYALGHSDHELRRLAEQAALIGPTTRRFLVEAGIVPGMRVLDVGSGIGDVAFLAAELVTEAGSVVGADRAPDAIATARRRAEERSLTNVTFEVGDPAGLAFAEPFDAVIGRYVLQFQPDAGAMLRLVSHVRPGGVIAFHEIDWSWAASFPPVALWDRCCRLAVEALTAGGADTRSGSRLPATFAAAGLPAPTVRMSAVAGAGAAGREAVDRTVRLLVTLLPALEKLGLVTAGELDVPTLADRILAEAEASHSILVATGDIAAWARVEGG